MDELAPFDRFFAETLLKRTGIDSKESILALGRLMKGARMGRLSMDREQLGEGIESIPPSVVEEGTTLFPKAPVVRWETQYYLQKNWVYETYILQESRRLEANRLPSYIDRNRFEEQLTLFSNRLLSSQAAAIRSILDHSLTLICGGPGTGKTYTAAYLVKCLVPSVKKSMIRVALAAPTGKAASHLQASLQALGCADPRLHLEASTLHKLLKIQPGESRLFSGARIDADLILVDEASMIDISLMAHLLEAVGDESLLVLIGDPHQLPPVEAGSLFADIAKRYGTPLDRSMRTEDNRLQQLAEAVKLGDSEVFFRHCPHPNSTLSVEELYARIGPIASSAELDPQTCLEQYGRIRLLNAMRQGPEGADAMNRQLFDILRRKGARWAAPILATINDSFTEIYNGMSGILVGARGHEEAAYFPDPASGQLRRFSTPPPFELAFCLSIHKSQGSEFDEVIALFPDGSEHFGRESLYTAITRAKKKLEIVGSCSVLQKMIETTSGITSGFLKRIDRPDQVF